MLSTEWPISVLETRNGRRQVGTPRDTMAILLRTLKATTRVGSSWRICQVPNAKLSGRKSTGKRFPLLTREGPEDSPGPCAVRCPVDASCKGISGSPRHCVGITAGVTHFLQDQSAGPWPIEISVASRALCCFLCQPLQRRMGPRHARAGGQEAQESLSFYEERVLEPLQAASSIEALE